MSLDKSLKKSKTLIFFLLELYFYQNILLQRKKAKLKFQLNYCKLQRTSRFLKPDKISSKLAVDLYSWTES